MFKSVFDNSPALFDAAFDTIWSEKRKRKAMIEGFVDIQNELQQVQSKLEDMTIQLANKYEELNNIKDQISAQRSNYINLQNNNMFKNLTQDYIDKLSATTPKNDLDDIIAQKSIYENTLNTTKNDLMKLEKLESQLQNETTQLMQNRTQLQNQLIEQTKQAEIAKQAEMAKQAADQANRADTEAIMTKLKAAQEEMAKLKAEKEEAMFRMERTKAEAEAMAKLKAVQEEEMAKLKAEKEEAMFRMERTKAEAEAMAKLKAAQEEEMAKQAKDKKMQTQSFASSSSYIPFMPTSSSSYIPITTPSSSSFFIPQIQKTTGIISTKYDIETNRPSTAMYKPNTQIKQITSIPQVVKPPVVKPPVVKPPVVKPPVVKPPVVKPPAKPPAKPVATKIIEKFTSFFNF